eukprot:4896715-Pyramimonas_sp.AAC.1
MRFLPLPAPLKSFWRVGVGARSTFSPENLQAFLSLQCSSSQLTGLVPGQDCESLSERPGLWLHRRQVTRLLGP